MPRHSPHPLALFSLKPQNDRARDVVAHPCNSHLVSTLADGTLVLDVGFHTRPKILSTLATLGRDEAADIFVDGASIARTQCSFEIDLKTNVVMLFDRSTSGSTQVHGPGAMQFLNTGPRGVLVHKDLNTIIGMGGEARNLVQFQLIWHPNAIQTAEKLKHQGVLSYPEETPRLTRTTEAVQSVVPCRRETRLHIAGNQQSKMRYLKGKQLGSGQFGTVYKAIDVDGGDVMAVKFLNRPTEESELEKWRTSVYQGLKREVEILSEISHPHIVGFIASQGWAEPRVEIFMSLAEGTLESLIESQDCEKLAPMVLSQMLQALDHLAWKGIVHRDLKPQNILYTTEKDGQYRFQLGDFGLSCRVNSAAGIVGSPLYQAPEVSSGEDYSHKVDVWSLFVTILWILDVGEFRQKSRQFQSALEAQRAVLHAAPKDPNVSLIREMAAADPRERPSAAQLLVKLYKGKGLTTPAGYIPDFPAQPENSD